MNVKGVVLIIICFTLGQCTTKKLHHTGAHDTTAIEPAKASAAAQESYEVFISKFDSDTTFQKSRIKYDLSRYYKTYVNMSISAIDTNEFRITTRKSDKVVVRVTNRKDTTFGVQYFFTKEGGKWYLTDYWDNYDE